MQFDKLRKNVPFKTVAITELGKKVDDFQIMDCPLDLRNQRVIKADAERTRHNSLKSVWKKNILTDKDLSDDILITLEKILTFYTKNSNTTYK